jgi:hypothetical protein
MAKKNRLFSGAANGSGTVLDLGAGAAWDKINFQVSAAGGVTAHTVTLKGSADNSTYVNIAEFDKVSQAEGTLRVLGAYRYLQAVLSNYAGSGNVVLDVRLGRSITQF